MSTSSVPQGFLGEFSSNQRIAVAVGITVIHTTVIISLFYNELSQWWFLTYITTASLITAIIPFLATAPVIKLRYKSQSMDSYLTTLSESSDEPIASEIELTPDVLQKLPNDVSNPDSVKVIDEELLDHVDGEEFDPVDADVRGVIAIGFASLPIVISGPVSGILLGGITTTILGFVFGVVASAIVLQQHRAMTEIIAYTPKAIDS